MSEHIKELAKQAVEETRLLMIMEYKNFESKLYEKFAELIVKECINVLDKEVGMALREDGEQAYVDVILLEHFGVE